MIGAKKFINKVLMDWKNSLWPAMRSRSATINTVKWVHSKNSIKESGGRLKAQTPGSYILQEFKVEYTIFNVCRLLHQLGFSWITTSSRHSKQSNKIQEISNKFNIEMLRTIPWNVRLKNVDDVSKTQFVLISKIRRQGSKRKKEHNQEP